jgi:flagellar basal-body rod protein FlgB
MPNTIFGDNTVLAGKLALDGLSARQQVISRNIANNDTPGYKAQDLNFEDALKSVFGRQKGLALESTNASHITSSSKQTYSFSVSDRAGGSERADGNNVDTSQELMDMSEIGIEYQALTQAVSKRLALLKSIATAR